MKKLFFIENLLWLFAILLGIYTAISLVPFTGLYALPIDYTIKTAISVAIEWLWMILPGYLIHYFLRSIKQRKNIICVFHVILTIITGSFSANFATSVIPGWHTTIYPPLFDLVSIGLPFVNGILFWLLQIAFILYGMTVINRWRKASTS